MILKQIPLLILLAMSSVVYGQYFQNNDADKVVKGSKRLLLDEKNSNVKFLEIDENVKIKSADRENWLKKSIGVSAKQSLKRQSEFVDKEGFVHQKYQIQYNNIPIEWNYYTLHLKNNEIISANGEYSKIVEFNTHPQLSESHAFNIAKGYVNATVYNWEALKQDRPQGELVIMPQDSLYYLTYKFDIFAEQPLSRKFIYVDANNGSILKVIDRIHEANSIGSAETLYNGTVQITTDSYNGSYRLRETSRGSGIETYDLNNGTSYASAVDFIDADNNWTDNTNSDKAAYDAHFATEATYDYYYTKFNRNSYDNLGSKMISYVHYSSNYANAFWNGSYMTYGDGDGSTYLPLTPIEVVAHEITHGVVETTSNLVYSKESGALNESFADIFGICVDFEKNPTTANYLMGDAMSVTHTPFRSMQNPNTYGDPDTYLGTYWVSGTADNGGVHSNSGVQNFWFYLLCNGGSGTNDLGNSYTVNGIGMTKAAQIAYRNMSYYLTANSGYADARFYSIQSAIDLFGDCSAEVIAVTNAWYAVGVGGIYDNSVVANFVASQTDVCQLNRPVNFFNNSQRGASYIWNFGDGQTSTLKDPVHNYTAAGIYSVSLTTTGISSCNNSDVETKNSYITVTNGTALVAPNCIPRTLTPGAGGIYKFVLNTITKTTNGSVDNYQDFTCSHQTTLVEGRAYDLEITLGTVRPENLYIWIDLNNDGSFTNSSELIYSKLNVTGKFNDKLLLPKAISYNTALRMRVGTDYTTNTLTDACTNSVNGQFHDYSVVITQNNLAPEANFTSNKMLIVKNDVVSFTDNSQNIPTSWQWSFPGGTPSTSTLQNPQVTYPTAGNYNVTLVATNAKGTNTITKTGYIAVLDQFYCKSNLGGSGCPGDISGFSITGTTLNNLSHTVCSATDGSSYAQYPFSGNTTAMFDIGSSYEFNVTTSTSDIISIWIDYNQNGVFESIEWTQVTTSSSAGVASKVNIMIPNYTKSGSTGLRVRSRWSGNPNSSTDACSNFGSGMTEDYFITIKPQTPTIPIANFSSKQDVVVGELIQFSDLTQGVPTSWNWQFNGGASSISSSTLQNPTVSYSTPGVYSVTLTASNALGTDVETKTDYINVHKFLYCTSNLGGGGCPGDISLVAITGTSLNNSSHTICNSASGSTYAEYPESGSNTTSLQIGNIYELGVITTSSDIISMWIDYNQDGVFESFEWQQVATVSGSNSLNKISFKIPNNALAGKTKMRIRSRANGNPNGSTDACSSFGSGITEDYTVTLVAPTPTIPVANFSAKQSVAIGEVVQFSDLTLGVPTSWQWTFSGGASSISTSTLQNPTVTYSAAGSYAVTLVASNSLGTNTITKTAYITVLAALPGEDCLNALNLSTLTSPYSGTTVGYKNNFTYCNINSSPDIIFYQDVPAGKIFTIGQTTNSFDSRHTLRVGGSCPGTTEVSCIDDSDTQTMTYTNNTTATVRAYFIIDGYSSTSTGTFTIAWSISNPPAPVANFSVNQTNVAPGTTVNFTDLSTNAPNAWQWSFTGGNITSSTLQNPSVTYTTEGVYTVSLTASNGNGSNTITKTGYIVVSKYTYCKSNLGGSGSCPGDITTVSITGTTLNNSSHTNCSTLNYSTYGSYPASGNTTANLTKGLTYSLNVTTSSRDIVSVWIDYNQNGVFESTEWNQVTTSSVIGVPSTVNIAIPTTALTGETGMRIRSRGYGNTNGSYDACSNFGSGITEDYFVTIQAPIPTIPVANFSAKQSVAIGEVVQFSDLTSGVPTSWQWSFSGGASSISTSTLQNPTVTYSAAGSYSVTLVASNSLGTNTITKTAYITVFAALPGEDCPNALNLSTLTSPYNGTTVGYKNNFTYCNTNSSPDIIFYQDVPAGKIFTIGQTLNNFDSRHTLRVGGSCPGVTEVNCIDDSDTQTLTYTNSTTATVRAYFIIDGYSTSTTGTFTLAWSLTTPPAPVANFSANQVNVTPGTIVNFTDLSTNTPNAWQWSFTGGNITSSTLQNPSVTYSTVGVYAVTLTASNVNGSNTITKTAYINVQPALPGDNCTNALNLSTLTSPYNGTTVGYKNNFTYCNINSSPDIIFYQDVPAGKIFTIGQTTNNFDSRHTLRVGGSCPGVTEISCIDDSDTQTLTYTNSTAATVRAYFIIDGYSTSTTGTFTLAWSLTTPPAPVANFSASQVFITPGTTVNFTDLSTNAPNAWQWSFTGGNIASSILQNPSVTYATEGVYPVTLTASNVSGSNTITKTAYITVSRFTYCRSGLGGSGYCPGDITALSIVGTTLNNSSHTNCSTSNSSTYASYPSSGNTTASLSKGSTYQLSVTTSNSDIISVWIDYNQNGVFETSEWNQVATTSVINVPSTVNITIPTTALTGQTGMRVRTALSGTYNGSSYACYNFTSGITEDYIVTIQEPISTIPVANFSAKKSVTVGEVVQFTDLTLGVPTSWQWTFSGGASSILTSTIQNPTVTYTAVGSYSVTLVASNSLGSNTITKTAYITVLPALPGEDCPNALNLSTLTSPYNGTTVGYKNNFTYCNTYSSPDIIFYQDVPVGKIFTIGQTTNSFDSRHTLRVGGSCPGTTVINCIDDSDTQSLTYTNSTTATVRAYFIISGYDALTTGTFTLAWSLTNPPVPVANFSANQVNVTPGTTVNFTDLSTNTPNAWQWSFTGGNITTSTLQNPSVTYSTVGVYAVTLTASNGNGSNTITKTAYINVQPALPGDDCANALNLSTLTSPYNGTTVGYKNNFTYCNTYSSPDIIFYQDVPAGKIFTIGQTTNSFDSRHTLRVDGVCPGTTVINCIDDSDTQSLTYTNSTTATVRAYFIIGGYDASATGTFTLAWSLTNPPAPVANFSANQVNVTPGTTVNFTDLSTNAPNAWQWSFTGGNITTSTLQNPSVTYTTEGVYTVSLTASNGNGSNTVTKTGYIVVSKNIYCKSGLGGSGSCPGDITALSITGTTLNNISHTNCSILNSSTYASYPATGNTTASLSKGSIYPLSVTTSSSDIVSVWIDYNQNGVFESTEWNQVATTSVVGVPSTVNISIPTTALTGQTGMRIRSRAYGSMNGSLDACTNFASGITEDYFVTITSGIATTPLADFIADKTIVTTGSVVKFSDKSTNNPTNWSWTFSGGNTSLTSSTLQNPSVIYNAEGLYSVTLTTSNTAGSNTITKSGYILVTNSSYCISNLGGSNSCPGDITAVAISGTTLNNLSHTNCSLSNSSTYATFPAAGNTTGSIAQGNSYQLSVSTSVSDAISVWIDFNRNGVFDVSEWSQVATASSVGVTNSVIITVPKTASLGQTTMRIRTRAAGFTSLATDACVQYGSGITEDYKIVILSSPSNVNDGFNNSNYNVYPNPASSDLFVESDQTIQKVEIMDVGGKVVITNDLIDAQKTNVDISNLYDGVYFVRIYSVEGMIIRKIIKKE